MLFFILSIFHVTLGAADKMSTFLVDVNTSMLFNHPIACHIKKKKIKKWDNGKHSHLVWRGHNHFNKL